MPQIQILPQNPGFSSQLGASIGGGLSQGIGVALQDMLAQRAQQEKSQQLLDALGISRGPSDQSQAISSLSGEAKPTSPTSVLEGLTPEKIIAVSSINPQIGGILSTLYAGQEKAATKRREEQRSEDIAQDSLNRMAELLGEGKLGFGAKRRAQIFGGKTGEDVGEFESLTGALESLLKDRVSKGMLSNARFKYITETLIPKASDRDAIIKGKLRGLSRELGLKPPSSVGGKSLDKSLARKFLEEAGGDKVKARELARAQGYAF